MVFVDQMIDPEKLCETASVRGKTKIIIFWKYEIRLVTRRLDLHKIHISGLLNNRSRVWKQTFWFSWDVYLRAASATEIRIFSIKSNFLQKNKFCGYVLCSLLSTGTWDCFFVEPIGSMWLTLLAKSKSLVIEIRFCKGMMWYDWFYLREII